MGLQNCTGLNLRRVSGRSGRGDTETILPFIDCKCKVKIADEKFYLLVRIHETGSGFQFLKTERTFRL